jgi:hypothetical protein
MYEDAHSGTWFLGRFLPNFIFAVDYYPTIEGRTGSINTNAKLVEYQRSHFREFNLQESNALSRTRRAGLNGWKCDQAAIPAGVIRGHVKVGKLLSSASVRTLKLMGATLLSFYGKRSVE